MKKEITDARSATLPIIKIGGITAITLKDNVSYYILKYKFKNFQNPLFNMKTVAEIVGANSFGVLPRLFNNTFSVI